MKTSKYKEPKYKINIYYNGEFYKVCTSNDEMPYSEMEKIIETVVDKGYKEISLSSCGREGYYIYFNEEKKESFCISYKTQEWTEFYDSKNNPIYVEDYVKSIYNDTIYQVLCHGGFFNTKSEYYIRHRIKDMVWRDYELNEDEAKHLIKV